MGVHNPNSKGHTEAPESITPTRGATLKHGSPSPQLEGPHRGMGVHDPSSRGRTEAWESITPTQEATPRRGSPSEPAQNWAKWLHNPCLFGGPEQGDKKIFLGCEPSQNKNLFLIGLRK